MRIPRPALRLDITRWTSAVLIAGIVVAGCSAADDAAGGSRGPTPAPDAIDVVATTTVLADLVRQVGGSQVNATSLVPPGGEVHTFDPTPADIARVADADLVVTNGLGLDDWVADLARDSGSQAPVVALGEDLEGVSYLAGDEHDGEAVNPHLWLDVSNAIQYVDRIGEQLAAVDPAHASALRGRSAAYTERLRTLDAWVREQIESVPAEDRKIVSFHDAFPYFATAYGLEIVGTVIDAPGAGPKRRRDRRPRRRDPGLRGTARVQRSAIQPALAQTIAEEAGVRMVSGSLHRLARSAASRHVRGDDPLGRRTRRGCAPAMTAPFDPHEHPHRHPDERQLPSLEDRAVADPEHARSHASVWLTGVTAGYDHRAALEAVDIAVEPGTLLAIVGPNGAGKSTLLKLMAGLLQPWAGRIEVLGEPPGRQARRIAYVPQAELVDWAFPVTVGDVVMMGRYPALGPLPAWPPIAVGSMSAVRNPSDSAYTAADRPAGPPPTTMRS